MLSDQAKRWLTAAGAQLVPAASTSTPGPSGASGSSDSSDSSDSTSDHNCNNEALCEVSSLVSYAGEGLEQYAGQQLSIPFYLH